MANTLRYGRCTNKTRCSLAFNRESVLVPVGGACPECGQPLKERPMSSKPLRLLGLLIVLGALGAGGYYIKKHMLDPVASGSGTAVATRDGGSGMGSVALSSAAGTRGGDSASVDASAPTPKPGLVDDPDFEATAANVKARQDVLKRVQKMPHLTDDQKAKLIDSVGRARNMGCIFIIPFQAGQRMIGDRESEILVGGFKSPAIQQLMKDPTVVFVVLGYADKQGDAQTNEKVSTDRAQSVLSVMKDRSGVQNVTYGVGMGGSDMFDGKSAAKEPAGGNLGGLPVGKTRSRVLRRLPRNVEDVLRCDRCGLRVVSCGWRAARRRVSSLTSVILSGVQRRRRTSPARYSRALLG